MRKTWRISFPTLLFLSFASGVVIGTITANLLNVDIMEQIGYFDSFYKNTATQNKTLSEWTVIHGGPEYSWAAWTILKKRLLEFGLAVLLGMTPLAILGMMGLLFAGGIAYGIQLSIFTFQKGWLGILAFLASILPHWLCYLAAWTIVLAGSRKEYRKMKLKAWLMLILLIGAGLWLEINIKINF